MTIHDTILYEYALSNNVSCFYPAYTKCISMQRLLFGTSQQPWVSKCYKELKNLKTLEGGIWLVSCCIWIELSTKNRAWITDDTCKLCKDCIPWNQVFKECIHWLDLDLRWNLTLESLLRPIKESIHRCLKIGPYIWAYQNWGKWSASKKLEGKKTPVHGKEELEC